jgi:hypothetical protein
MIKTTKICHASYWSFGCALNNSENNTNKNKNNELRIWIEPQIEI